MHWPGLQPESGRGGRKMPLHERLAAAGAAFGDAGGWERPAWYAPGSISEPAWRYDFDRPGWHGAVGEEVRATREGVALYDLSTYSKFLVLGRGAASGLQKLCASDVDVEPGRVVYTTILNGRAGVEMDPTVTRLSEDRYLVLAPTLAQRRTEWLLRNGLGSDATVTDLTGGIAALHLAGPRSRELLGRLTGQDLSNDAFPFLSANEIDVGWARAWALRVSYTGELGWELYVSGEFASDLYDKIVEAGRDLGLRHAGAFAFDASRLERGFRSWGHDMGSVDDVFACGLGFTAGKGDFVGAEACEKLRSEPRHRLLVSVRLGDPDPMLWHGESVLRSGERVGHVSSGGYGYTLGSAVGLAWIHAEGEVTQQWLDSEPIEVEVRDRRIPAVASIRPLYEPASARS
jgi:heterotetrameric sarcosine oxidase gamma subunit